MAGSWEGGNVQKLFGASPGDRCCFPACLEQSRAIGSVRAELLPPGLPRAPEMAGLARGLSRAHEHCLRDGLGPVPPALPLGAGGDSWVPGPELLQGWLAGQSGAGGVRGLLSVCGSWGTGWLFGKWGRMREDPL